MERKLRGLCGKRLPRVHPLSPAPSSSSLATSKQSISVAPASQSQSQPQSQPQLPPSTALIECFERAPVSPESPNLAGSSVRVGRLLLWSAVVLVHLLCALFYAACAFLYHKIPTTIVAVNMRAFGLSIDTKHFPVLAVLHGLCSSIHALLLLEMLLHSVAFKVLVFTHEAFLQQELSQSQSQSRQNQHRRQSYQNYQALSLRTLQQVSFTRTLKRALCKLLAYWSRWFGHDGVFGVDQSYFRSLFLLRELGEIALQSYQAFKMSRLVPRVWLNQLYVALIAGSCWSTPVLEFLYRKQHARHGLRMCLFVDVVLDFVSTVGIPTLLSIPYLKGYDPRSQDFSDDCWNSDIWYMNMVNEFQLLFIQSWADCIQHFAFSVSLLLCLDDVKILASDDGDAETKANQSDISTSITAVAEVTATTSRPPVCASTTSFMFTTRPQPSSVSPSAWCSQHRLSTVAHTLMVLWGIIVASLHLEAQRDGDPVVGCRVLVHPWYSPKTACSLLQIDCTGESSHLTPAGGATSEIEGSWETINDDMLVLLTIGNCPSVQMPPSIQRFSRLMGLNLFNSTVVEWGTEAALTKDHHANMRHLSMITVNLTPAAMLGLVAEPNSSSMFPPGLMALDFPSRLHDIFILDVNLQAGLPAELPSCWPQQGNIMLIADGLDQFPEPLLHMAPIRIALDYNAITTVPISVFEIDSLVSLELPYNPIHELPEPIAGTPFSLGVSFTHMNLKFTSISQLPQWMREKSFLEHVRVRAGGSPLCVNLAGDSSKKSAQSRLLAKYIDCSE